MKKVIGCLTIVHLLFLHVGSAQTLPYLRNISTIARVTGVASNSFLYSYDLINDANNDGNIWIYQVDISTRPNAILYDTVGLPYANYYTEFSFRISYPGVAGKIVPVGFPSVPVHWNASIAVNRTASFGPDTHLPEPGQSVNGIQMVSRGLPGIREFTVIPVFDLDYFPGIEDSNALSFAQMDSIEESVNYHGWTVGPSAVDSSFVALNFLDTLISYTTRSRTFGWITSQSTADKYAGLFVRAKSDIRAANVPSARTRLDTVLTTVHADSGATLTSEAYALLRFNTEYLVRMLAR